MNYLTKSLGVFLVASMALTVGPAASDPKPSGAKRVSAKVIQNLYAGKTHPWSKGGVYYAANGQFKQIWEKDIGLGTWSVDKKGNLCRDVRYLKGGQASPPRNPKGDDCNWHVQTSDGSIWVNDWGHKPNSERANEWWRIAKEGGVSDKLQDGNKIAKAYGRIEKKERFHRGAYAADANMKPIKKGADFIATVVGQRLWSSKKSYIDYNADGTYSGKWKGNDFTATWKWKGAHLCRVLNGQTKEDCQAWKGDGTNFRGASQKGKGAVWYLGPKKSL